MHDSKTQLGCGNRAGETPDLIPNSEVKPGIGEYSARVTWCETSKSYPFFKKPSFLEGFFFAFFLTSHFANPFKISRYVS